MTLGQLKISKVRDGFQVFCIFQKNGTEHRDTLFCGKTFPNRRLAMMAVINAFSNRTWKLDQDKLTIEIKPGITHFAERVF